MPGTVHSVLVVGARLELARFISPIEYRFAESTYDGEAYSMALRDYQTPLEQRIRYGAEMVGQQP